MRALIARGVVRSMEGVVGGGCGLEGMGKGQGFIGMLGQGNGDVCVCVCYIEKWLSYM